MDLDAAGDVVGFDIDAASRRLDLTTLETIAFPNTDDEGLSWGDRKDRGKRG